MHTTSLYPWHDVFEPPATGGVQFRQAAALTPDAVASITEQARRRVVRRFPHR